MFGYATHMRSSTQGRANYSMQFKQYEEAPRSVAEEIIAQGAGQGSSESFSHELRSPDELAIQFRRTSGEETHGEGKV